MKQSILCVDDEIDNVEALERLFRRKYNVLKATSGAEALKILKANKVALILTDQRMPGMTGVEFLAESVRVQPEPVRILLTGFTDIESVISAINSGQVYRYVTKPWDPVDLANTIDKAVEVYEMSAELKIKNQALQSALKELKTLDEAKSNFMILINHELKTPLTVILSYLELIQETALDDDQKKYLSRIASGSERLRVLIEDSLELVSAETGILSVKMANINLKKLIGDLGKNFAAPLTQKKMDLSLALETESVRADAKALRSVLSRLLDNAIKFGFEKSSIEFIARETAGGKVLVTMVNDGKSLKAEMLEKILKPFALDENVMNHSKGTGLGLSVVQALLHRLDSELVIDLPKGKFSASFELPAG